MYGYIHVKIFIHHHHHHIVFFLLFLKFKKKKKNEDLLYLKFFLYFWKFIFSYVQINCKLFLWITCGNILIFYFFFLYIPNIFLPWNSHFCSHEGSLYINHTHIDVYSHIPRTFSDKNLGWPQHTFNTLGIYFRIQVSWLNFAHRRQSLLVSNFYYLLFFLLYFSFLNFTLQYNFNINDTSFSFYHSFSFHPTNSLTSSHSHKKKK